MELLTLPLTGMAGLIGGLPTLLYMTYTAFWVWMLVDIVRKDDSQIPGSWEYRRAAWAVAVAFLHVSAFAYLFAVYLRDRTQQAETYDAAHAGAATPPAQQTV